jgi:Tfp pilus assembly protein PilN
MIEINLLPVDEEMKPRLGGAQRGLGFEVPRFIPRGFGAAIVLMLALYGIASFQASFVSRSLENSKQTLHDLRESDQQAKALEARLPSLRDRAKVFQERVENRKMWSKILKEITLSCPQKIQLTEITLTLPRTALPATQQSKELLIKGFYLTDETLENVEMNFTKSLQSNKSFAMHYPRIIAMTNPQAGKTDFTIRCTEQ